MLTEDLKSINNGKYMECKRSYCGFVMTDQVNEWFSAAIGKVVVLLHSDLGRLNYITKKNTILCHEGDQAKCFTFDGSMHLINEASVRDLKERVLKKYPESERDLF